MKIHYQTVSVRETQVEGADGCMRYGFNKGLLDLLPLLGIGDTRQS